MFCIAMQTDPICKNLPATIFDTIFTWCEADSDTVIISMGRVVIRPQIHNEETSQRYHHIWTRNRLMCVESAEWKMRNDATRTTANNKLSVANMGTYSHLHVGGTVIKWAVCAFIGCVVKSIRHFTIWERKFTTSHTLDLSFRMTCTLSCGV